jgi:hypothetical protein
MFSFGALLSEEQASVVRRFAALPMRWEAGG